jgi:hypothetical protein
MLDVGPGVRRLARAYIEAVAVAERVKLDAEDRHGAVE